MGVEMLCCGPVPDRAELRRRRIIEAARILFVDNGFHATGVAQIAKASGIAVGQIYRDFEAKEDIVAAIVENDCAAYMVRESLHRAIDAGDSAAVWAWIRDAIEPVEHCDTEPLFAEIVAESGRNERIAGIVGKMNQERGDNMRAALALLAPGDHLARRRDLLSDLILIHSLGLMQHRLLQPAFEIGELVDMVMSAIAREIDAMRASVAAFAGSGKMTVSAVR